MQVGEAIAVAMPHTDDHPKCPFCPLESVKDFTTYEGDKNDSKILKSNMNSPNSFPSNKESGARPKEAVSTSHKEWLKEPTPIGTYTDATVGEYSAEAHHLVSGKQALANKNGHKFEQWIKSSHGTIEKDTGYSVNNYINGIWMPSVPKKTIGNKGAWAKMDRQAIANYIMSKTKRQFHKGGHSIKETRLDNNNKRVEVPNDERIHQKYDTFLKKKLTTMNDRMNGWSNVCPMCFEGDIKKEKLQPTERVNKAIDRLGGIANKQITGPRSTWTLFISSLAWIYHEEVCKHKKDELSL